MNLQTARRCATAAGLLMLAVPTWAGSQIEKTLKLNPGGCFVLEAHEGSVDLMGSDQSGVSVVISGENDDFQNRVDLSFEEEGDTVRIRERRRYWDLFDFLFDPLGLHYQIRVPKSTTLEIRTGGGSIRVYSMAGDTDLKTSGGSIEVSVSGPGSILSQNGTDRLGMNLFGPGSAGAANGVGGLIIESE